MTRTKGKKSKARANAANAAADSLEMSLSDYARRRGVSAKSVTQAVQQGRLRQSLGQRRDGRRYVADAELADAEWARNTQSSARVISEIAEAGVPPLAVSRAKREAAAARLLELDVEEREGKVVAIEAIRAEVRDEYTIVKTQILGVPSRLAQRLPHLAAEVVPVVDELLREALLELAADGGDRQHDDEGEDEP